MKTRAVNLILAIILVLGASCSAFAAVAVPNPLSPASGASLNITTHDLMVRRDRSQRDSGL